MGVRPEEVQIVLIYYQPFPDAIFNVVVDVAEM